MDYAQEFYERKAGEWYAKREQYRYDGDYPKFAHAEREFKNYCAMARLPDDWKPKGNESE